MGGKFARQRARPNVQGPVKTTEPAVTYEGGEGFSRDAKSDLFLLAVSNMVSEDTYYEGASERDERFRNLVHQVTKEDPQWVRGFVPYLREKMFMRSASVVAAAEYVAAGGENGRGVIASTLKRADEPGEILAYWMMRHGRNIPQPVKRGVADATVRLYNEFSALKYDGGNRVWRMGDVIELTHPKAKDSSQSSLFKYLLDSRHHASDDTPEGLAVISGFKQWVAAGAPLEYEPELPQGVTWEVLSSYHKMDAKAWEAVIPKMGYMALLRNLRNFEQAGINADAELFVRSKLASHEEVLKSKQFPFRFLSAYKALDSLTFGPVLEQALEYSVENIPSLKGRTLIMVDVSGSMFHTFSQRGHLELWEQASLFGVALAKRAEEAHLVIYSNDYSSISFTSSASVLRTVHEKIRSWPRIGGGTRTMQTLREVYGGQDRVIILTDEQAFYSDYDASDIPLIYTFNLAGYRTSHLPSGELGRYSFGGLSDAAFNVLAVLEDQRHAGWPWVSS